MKTLKISKEVSLPLDLVTQTVAILAKRRVGKSYTMRRLSEQLLDAGQQVVLVDPKGDQWGIRSSADGKKAGYPIVILGGEHGDVPLEANAGELVAKLVVEERVSILIDLSMFRKHEVATFMTAFMENLYRLKAQEKYRTPVMLVIDEADAIAPQKPQKGEERMLGAAEDIVRRGGQRGIGCILVTQRSAVLNKNVLTQAQMLIVLRTIAPQDLSAMKAWIDVHGTIEEGKELMESLPSLPVGDAWLWSPGWPTNEGIFKRVHILPIETFDSGATPKPGERKIVPKNLADVDLDALKNQMSEVIEKAKADDPKELKKRIAVLEKASKDPGPNTQSEKEIKARIEKEISARDEAWKKKLDEANKEIKRYALIVSKIAEIVGTQWSEKIQTYRVVEKPDRTAIAPGVVMQTDKPASIEPRTVTSDTSPEDKPLSKGARTVLTYLHSVYPHWKSKTQLWVATAYAPSGSFNNMVYELTGAGLIEKDGTGKYAARYQVYDQAILDSNFDVSLSKWDAKLSLGARKIFHILLDNSDSIFSKDDLANLAGYAMSGSFNNSIYELTGKELAVKEGNAYKINPEVLDL